MKGNDWRLSPGTEVERHPSLDDNGPGMAVERRPSRGTAVEEQWSRARSRGNNSGQWSWDNGQEAVAGAQA